MRGGTKLGQMGAGKRQGSEGLTDGSSGSPEEDSLVGRS